MPEIDVGLKLVTGNLRAQAREAVKEVQQEFGGGRTKASDWVNQMRANKAAGGQWNPANSSFGPPAPGGGGGGGMGPAGAAMLGGAAGGFVAMITDALAGLIRMMAQMIKNALVGAFREAASLYAKQLTSGGLTSGLISNRSVLAEVLGVGERDVWQYGAAVAYVNRQMMGATQEMSKNVRTVTAATWSWRMMGINMRSYMSQIAAALAPAVKQFADMISAIISFARAAGLGTLGASVWRTILHVLNVTILTVAAGTMTLVAALITLGDTIKWMLGISDPYKNSKEVWGELGKLFATLSRGNNGPVPEAAVGAQRMGASAWERMGLVIGSGGGANPMKQIERNTKKANEHLAKIASSIIPRGNNSPPKLGAGAINGR